MQSRTTRLSSSTARLLSPDPSTSQESAEESNAENLLIIKHHPALAAAFEHNFQLHWRHSTSYVGLHVEDPRHYAKKQIALNEKPDVTVFVTESGSKYHRLGCPYLAKSNIPIKLSDAKAKGYTASAKKTQQRRKKTGPHNEGKKTQPKKTTFSNRRDYCTFRTAMTTSVNSIFGLTYCTVCAGRTRSPAGSPGLWPDRPLSR